MTAHGTAAAEDLDRRLGDPHDPGRLFSHPRCAELDEREEFPLEICRELDVLGLPAQYVPAEHGGALDSYPAALHVVRAVARRDLTVAIAHGKTFLGAVSVWTAGSPEQARALAAQVLDGRVVSWGLTERDHGSDLLAGDVRADPTPHGYRLHGEKWLINNATRGDLVTLLARTRPEGGPRGFSVLLVDKRRLAPGTHRPLPATRLHGIRGADISGIALDGADVPASALIGAEGTGAETVLKSLQVTRTLCAALSLGAGDQALGMATGYALGRLNHDRRLIDLPQSRRLLAQAYADLLTAEALALVAARSLHALPGELSVLSAATKYLVPALTDQALARLSRLVGTRSLLRGDVFEHGRFQKVLRDHRIVGIFDGSSVVNRHALISLFPALARAARRGTADPDGLRAATTLTADLPAFRPDRLELVPRGGCSALAAVPEAAAAVRALADNGTVPAGLAAHAERFAALAAGVAASVAAHRPVPHDVPAAAFTLAEHQARCVAGAAALHLWLNSRQTAERDDPHGLWTGGRWLEACLARLNADLRPARTAELAAGHDQESAVDQLVEPLVAQHTAGRLPSLLPHQPTGAAA